MKNLRSIILASSLGLVGLETAFAQDAVTSSAYSQLERKDILELLRERTVWLNDSNFKREVLDYSGAALVLFNSTCNRTEFADRIDRNMEIVYLNLKDKFESSTVNGLPIKFSTFDGCKYVGNNAQTIFSRNIITTETHMYLNGREIDRRLGGPINEVGSKASFENMSLWIEYTLLGIKQAEDKDRDIVGLYKGGTQLKVYPSSEIKK